jgi:hypothetical protein
MTVQKNTKGLHFQSQWIQVGRLAERKVLVVYRGVIAREPTRLSQQLDDAHAIGKRAGNQAAYQIRQQNGARRLNK